MSTYTDGKQRQLEAAEPKREPTLPTMTFDDWLTAELAWKELDAIEALVEEGWSEDDARTLVQQKFEDGEL